MQDAYVRIRDCFWHIASRPEVDNGDVYGHSDSERQRILIARYHSEEILVKPEDRLETLIHEMLHAEFPDLSEEAVERAGKSIATAIIETEIMEELEP